MAYSDFLRNISSKFEALFEEISAEYNFDYGPEFEIAFCKVLRVLLPWKYGICRGFVVTNEGVATGDDIIIYDQERFATLWLLEDKIYAQKQKIPVEAVYAYIEAKHTLCLEGDRGQSLLKAFSQVESVKSLTRGKVPLNQITPHITMSDFNFKRPDYWPNYFNPIYGAIISRHVRIKENEKACGVDEFLPTLKEYCLRASKLENPPDMIVAGANALVLPAVNRQIKSPFFIKDHSYLEAFKSDEQAFGVGLTSMMYALDSIVLGTIHWPTILATGLNLILKT